jgi:FlaA1/EpsC-like NDP-sugar epimerase
MINKIKHLIVKNRNSIVFIHDLIVIASAWIAAYIIRFNFEIPDAQHISMMSNLSAALIVQVIIFLGFRIHRASWRHSSIIDIRTIALAIFCSSLVLAIYFTFFYTQQPVIPRSIII